MGLPASYICPDCDFVSTDPDAVMRHAFNGCRDIPPTAAEQELLDYYAFEFIDDKEQE